jgi:hypothetical protein
MERVQLKKFKIRSIPKCLSGIAKDESYRIRRAEVILPVDADEFQFYDCAYEELLQSLGLINDDSSVPWTMFNDTCKWVSSTSTISTWSISFMIRASGRE